MLTLDSSVLPGSYLQVTCATYDQGEDEGFSRTLSQTIPTCPGVTYNFTYAYNLGAQLPQISNANQLAYISGNADYNQIFFIDSIPH